MKLRDKYNIPIVLVSLIFVVFGILGSTYLLNLGSFIVLFFPGIIVEIISQVVFGTGGSEAWGATPGAIIGTVVFWLFFPWLLSLKLKNKTKIRLNMFLIVGLASWSGGSVMGFTYQIFGSRKDLIFLLDLVSIIFLLSIIALIFMIHKTLKK